MYEGDLYLAGENVKIMELAEYRSRVALFPQDSYLFSGTLRSFLDPHRQFCDSKLRDLLIALTEVVQESVMTESPSSVANVSPTSAGTTSISTLAQNLDREITAGGNNLSAGERQVVVLARAALSSASDLVILDEITSNMDRQAASRALTLLKKELSSRGLGLLLIAHHMEDLMSCDEIWVMEDGLLVEQGNPMTLVQQEGGKFQLMWKAYQADSSQI